MLASVNSYRNLLVSLLMVIYLSGSFHVVAYEAFHLIMHLGDIVQLDYSHHSHNHNHSDSDEISQALTHDHGGVLNHSDSEQSSDDHEQLQVSKDKIEYKYASNVIINRSQCYKSNSFHYLSLVPQDHSFALFQPPQIQS